MGQETNEERAQQTFEKSKKIEEQFGNFFTGKTFDRKKLISIIIILVTIEEENLSDVYDRICEIIDHEETVHQAWIPSKEKI
jgi:hypothetical protein